MVHRTVTKIETTVQDCVSVLVSTFLDVDMGTFSSLFIGNGTQMFVIRLLGNLQLKVGYF